MTPIDLIDYTRSSKKIPAVILKQAPVATTPPSAWKILAGYFFDFVTVMTASTVITTIFEFSFNRLMVTRSLGQAFDKIPFETLSSTMLPLTFVSYFFFSYFFNHGQTFGMNTMKTRIEMPEMSFRASLLWGMFSASVFMTAGLSFVLAYKWMQKKGWGEVKGHDHLYQNLMTERNLSPVNLVELSSKQSIAPVETETEESYLKAA